MSSYPEEMPQWKKRSAWLRKGFQASKGTVDLLDKILDFINGDTTQSTMVHWCLSPGSPNAGRCCENDAEAWSKVASMLTAFLSNGYPVPLLYRMKHYATASSFIRVTCSMCGILRTVLNHMAEGETSSSSMADLADVLMANTRQVEDSTILDGNPSKLNENDLQMLISDLLDGDQSFATKNGARFNMAQREIAKNEFHQSSIIVDFIVQCMEPGINSFLKRTKILYDLQYLSHAHPKEAELRKTSKDMFLKVITGTLADELLSNYLALLGGGLQEALEMGLEGSEQQLTLIWQLVVSVMSDLYRRLKQEFESPPYTVLALSDADPTTFALEWNRLQQKFTACKYCVDIEFTSSLLEAYPGPLSANTRSGKQTITEIQRFLGSVCVWSPLTSDAVEILHGQLQWALSRRGSQHVKHGKAAVELSLLAQAVKQHTWMAEAVGKDTLPAKATSSRIRRFASTTSSNQHSARAEVRILVGTSSGLGRWLKI